MREESFVARRRKVDTLDIVKENDWDKVKAMVCTKPMPQFEVFVDRRHYPSKNKVENHIVHVEVTYIVVRGDKVVRE